MHCGCHIRRPATIPPDLSRTVWVDPAARTLQESVGVIIKHKPRRIQMPPITWQDIAEAVARGWTKHETEGTVMDPVLGEATELVE